MCSLTKPGAHQFIYTGWPMSSRSLPIPAPSIANGLMYNTMPEFYVHCGDPNSGPHACTIGTFIS